MVSGAPLQERFVSVPVALDSRHSVQRVERLFDHLPSRVQRSLEVPDVDELAQIPAVTERRAERIPELGVRVEAFPRLQQTDGRQRKI